MNVAQLRKILANPETQDSDEILLVGPDHTFVRVYPEFVTFLESKEGVLSEDHGEQVTPQAEYGERKFAIVFKQI